MKRLYVVVEGQTESEFIKSVVSPYLLQFSIYVTPIVMHTSRSQRGGMTSYNHLRNEVSRLLKSGKDDFVVTTFIDFYRIPEVPGKEKWESITVDNERVRMMRKCIDDEIGDRRFFLIFSFMNLRHCSLLMITALRNTLQTNKFQKQMIS